MSADTTALTIIAACAAGIWVCGLLIWTVLMLVIVPLLREIARR